MTDGEPLRLRLDPEVTPELRLALVDSAADFPSEQELAALRVALAVEVGEPVRMRREPRFALSAGLAGLNDAGPSAQQLRVLRARLPLSQRSSLPSRPRRRTLPRTMSALAWLAPLAAAAAAAGFWLSHQPSPERPAPATPQKPAPVPPVRVPEPLPSAVPAASAAPSSSTRASINVAPATLQPPKPSELELMRDARAALSADPSRALFALDRHAKLYALGVLAQEREVLAIDALLRLGRTGEANARATRFSNSYPSSAHWPHIQRLLSKAGL